MTALLVAEGASKSFGGLAAVSDVTLEVDKGDIHCLIGPNGAGKSTLFRLIVGMYPPSSGSHPFRRLRRNEGAALSTREAWHEHQDADAFGVQGIARPAEHPRRLAAPRPAGELASEESRLLELLNLTADATKLAGELSHGQQQWLEIGMALALRPKLLLLDEPTAGMSPEETYQTGELILRLNASGTTMLVVEHDMTFVRQIAKVVTVLHFGRVFARGSINEVINDPRVAEIYLGKTGHEH